MPPSPDNTALPPAPSMRRESLSPAIDGDDLPSDTIEVQTRAHPSPSKPDVVNLDGAAESRPVSAGPSSANFVNDISTEFVAPRPLSHSPALSEHPHGPLDQASATSKQDSEYDPATFPSGTDQNSTHFVPHSASSRQTSQPSISTPPPHGYYSTMRMSVFAPDINAASSKSSSRRLKQYTLPNGTVVSGKGLGRGRPGIKRGPRRPKTDETGRSVSNPGSVPGSAFATAVGKRGRAGSDVYKTKSETPDSDSMISASRESSLEYNPTGETRSGRKIQKPAADQIQVAESMSPAAKRPKLESRNTAPTISPAMKSHPKIKRRLYRGREQLALCEHCQRGHGPTGNNIVFCDACNRCWHQRCHEPQVPKSVIADTKAEWYCSSCEKILHSKKGKKAKLAASSSAAIDTPDPQFIGPLVGGAALTEAHKTAFLQSRTKEQLISLILTGSDLAPALPMFQMPAPQLPQAQFKSNYITPVSSTLGMFAAAAAADAEDEGYDSYFDEHAALYPKPGSGVKLPPEHADVHMLLEHPHSKTFSHWIRGMPRREFSGNADIVFQR